MRRGGDDAARLRPEALLPYAVGLALLATPVANAHRLDALVRRSASGERVLEAFFTDDAPARDARVVIRDPGGRELARGRTDAEGRMPLPEGLRGPLHLVVEDAAGHRTELDIPAAPDAPHEPAAAAGAGNEANARPDADRGPGAPVALPSGAPSPGTGSGDARGAEGPDGVVARSRPEGLAGWGPLWLRLLAGLAAIGLVFLLLAGVARHLRRRAAS